MYKVTFILLENFIKFLFICCSFLKKKATGNFKVVGPLVIFFLFSFLFLLVFFEAVLKSLSPVEPVESVSNSETPMNSDTEQAHSEATEEETSKPCASDKEDTRTEYMCDGPPKGQSKDTSGDQGHLLQGAHQCESEAKPPQAAAAGATAPPTPRDSPRLSIKQRLARLQLSPEYTFTAGLAAEVAARSLSFTTMQEQTFGDEEDEDKEQLVEGGERELEEK